MESSRQEYWSALPFPSPGDLPNPGIEPRSPALQTDHVSGILTGSGGPGYFGESIIQSTQLLTLICTRQGLQN